MSASNPNPAPSYAILSGGIGGAKLVVGLQQVLAAGQLQVIANTGDDFEHLGLPICPDIDTLIYTLAGVANPQTGWGLRDESWQFMTALEALGGPTWFRLGDRDLATHVQRREWLQQERTLSEAITALRNARGVRVPIWPMSDAPVRTIVDTVDGPLAFQDYFVRQQAQPVATGFRYTGSAAAHASPGALRALTLPDLGAIILTPSNPWLSIAPILSIQAIQTTISASAAPVIAVSPIVNGAAIKGPTAKLMRELGIEVSVDSIALHYRDILDGLVIDTQDRDRQDAIEAMGIRVYITNTVMQNLVDKAALAQHVVDFAAQLRGFAAMNDVWALLPVKSLQLSKTRLASLLQPQECASLSRAMLTDVLAALEESEHISKIAVLTNDKDIAALATRLGHLVIADSADSELYNSLNTAARQIAELGAKTLLIIPADMPTISARDIDELLERHTSGLSICPAIRDGGTNALVCTPPNAMPFQFGPDSARRHIDEATRQNIAHARLPMHAYFRDIDTPDDLAWLASQENALNTLQFMREAGIAARLGPGLLGASGASA